MQYAGTHTQPFEDWYRVIIMSTFSANNHNNTIQMHDWLSNNKILTNKVNNLYNSPAASLCSKQAKLNITTSAPGMCRSRCYGWFESRAAVCLYAYTALRGIHAHVTRTKVHPTGTAATSAAQSADARARRNLHSSIQAWYSCTTASRPQVHRSFPCVTSILQARTKNAGLPRWACTPLYTCAEVRAPVGLPWHACSASFDTSRHAKFEMA